MFKPANLSGFQNAAGRVQMVAVRERAFIEETPDP